MTNLDERLVAVEARAERLEKALNKAKQGIIDYMGTNDPVLWTGEKWTPLANVIRGIEAALAADEKPVADQEPLDVRGLIAEINNTLAEYHEHGADEPWMALLQRVHAALAQQQERIAELKEWDIRILWRIVQERQPDGLSHEDGWTLMPTFIANAVRDSGDAAEARAKRLEKASNVEHKAAMKPVTWNELADLYDATHAGRKARTLPMSTVFAWAEKDPRFHVSRTGTLYLNSDDK